MTPKRKLGAPAPTPSSAEPRDLVSRQAPKPGGYPSLRDGLAMPEIAALLKTFGRAAATMGLVAAAAATAAGCEPVECGTSRTDELTSHLDPTVQYVADLELKRAAEEVGVGIGIVPHPHTPMMAGLMAMPAYPVPATPPPPVPPGPALPETDAPDVAPELADQDVP